ncbi:MAG: putative Ig domain-containing protein [Ignavibacteriae bacterium]|nr:putative Ig domain-containing protein [Ignavibacteriota bacterium]
MKTFIIFTFYFLLASTCFPQPIPTDSLYLAQTPPGYTPKVFVLPMSGSLRPVERINISNNGKEIYFGELNTYPPTIMKIYCYKYLNDKWQGPSEVFNGFMAPALSPNDSIMYIQASITYDIARTYYSVRTGSGWSTPVQMFSFSQQSHYTQKTNLNNIFISTNFPGSGLRDLGKVIINGTDTTVTSIGLPINSILDESDFFIARDESYIIHARHSPTTAGDLFISYKKSNGSWTNSKPFGSNINFPSPTWEYGPFVTQDNKYLFFTRGGNAMSSYYTYWIKIDNIIDSLRHTNFIPYLKNQIPNQTDTVGNLFNFTFPDSTFVDDDGNNTLTYSSDNTLPAWLYFNPATRTFYGTPTAIGTFSLKVIATDTANVNASCVFTLNVVDPVSIHPMNENMINEYKLFQNYPNPFNPSTVISYSLLNNSNVRLKLYDVLGKEITTLVNSFQKKGVYDINFDMHNLNLSSGSYYYVLIVNESNSNREFRETKIMSYIK